MKRRAWTALSALSLLACGAIGVLWFWDSRHYGEQYFELCLNLGNGRTVLETRLFGDGISVALCRYKKPLTDYDPSARFIQTRLKGWFVGQIRVRGFAWAGFSATEQSVDEEFHAVVFLRRWRLIVPSWFLMVVTALVPASWVIRRRKQSRRQSRMDSGLCERCGYDLRASTDRCPECGAPNSAGLTRRVTQ